MNVQNILSIGNLVQVRPESRLLKEGLYDDYYPVTHIAPDYLTIKLTQKAITAGLGWGISDTQYWSIKFKDIRSIKGYFSSNGR